MRKILAVYAHPDDEAVLIGGTISKYSHEGVEVYLVCATKGEMGNSSLGKESPEELGKLREKELREAGKVLGIKEINFLGFIDGSLGEIETGKIEGRIRAEVERINPQVVITFEPDGMTHHQDHVVVGECTSRVVLSLASEKGSPKKLYWSVFSKNYLTGEEFVGMDGKAVLGESEAKITTRVNIEQYYDQKLQAVKKHQSQLQELEKYLAKAQEVPQAEECFILVNKSLGKQETDLFDGI